MSGCAKKKKSPHPPSLGREWLSEHLFFRERSEEGSRSLGGDQTRVGGELGGELAVQETARMPVARAQHLVGVF